jgi:uncharacterized membrane protein YgcG
MTHFLKFSLLLFFFTSTAVSVRAQEPVPPPAPANQPLSDAQLDQMLGPIALYPDPLIAEILPASTLPTQIVLADRYVTGGGDPSQIGQQPWDASVQAVARYPSVLKWMDDNLSETTELGQAFLNQQPAVMASIQRLRASASKLGNLQTTSQQDVTTDGDDIEIEPANDQEMYVPVYQPDQVYDDSADGSPFITFGVGYPIGDWLDNDFDWGNNDLIYWNQGYSRPANWWHESRGRRNNGHTTAWRPSNRSNTSLTNRGDRGWSQEAPSPEVTRQEQARQAPGQDARANTAFRPATAPGQNAPFISRPEANDALIGVQSTRDTRTYSDRGQQSMRTFAPSAQASRPQAVFHSAPASRPAPSFGGGGHVSGGGGGRAGGGGGGHAGGGGGHR